MKLKENVNMAGLKLQMRKALMAANQVWSENGQELVVTSALDGEHSPSSLHYYGYALDFRTRYFDDKTLPKVIHEYSEALRYLDVAYRMVVHDTHIHVEWRGTVTDDIYNNTIKHLQDRRKNGTLNRCVT
jgi:hypothetical protein